MTPFERLFSVQVVALAEWFLLGMGFVVLYNEWASVNEEVKNFTIELTPLD